MEGCHEVTGWFKHTARQGCRALRKTNFKRLYKMIRDNINGVELVFETAEGIFSPLYLDKGTLAMLSLVSFEHGDKVLDLGCGYGLVGIYAAKLIGENGNGNIYMSDVDEKCVELSGINAGINKLEGVNIIHSDGFNNIREKDFSLILSNPPYNSDFAVAKHFIEKGFNRLAIGGRFYMVTKRKDWYKNKFTAVFGGVKIYETEGYFIFCAEKRGTQYANKK